MPSGKGGIDIPHVRRLRCSGVAPFELRARMLTFPISRVLRVQEFELVEELVR
jgi:hypothetical protein